MAYPLKRQTGSSFSDNPSSNFRTLRVEAAEIDVFDFGLDTGRIVEKMPDA